MPRRSKDDEKPPARQWGLTPKRWTLAPVVALLIVAGCTSQHASVKAAQCHVSLTAVTQARLGLHAGLAEGMVDHTITPAASKGQVAVALTFIRQQSTAAAQSLPSDGACGVRDQLLHVARDAAALAPSADGRHSAVVLHADFETTSTTMAKAGLFISARYPDPKSGN